MLAVKTSSDVEEKFVEFLNKGEFPYDYERHLLKNHFDRIVDIFGGGNPLPYELEIQTSSVCDINCSHCFGRHYTRLPNKIRKTEIDKLAGDIEDFESKSKFKIQTIKFCGSTGEPLVNPYTAYAIDVFAKQKKKIRLFTNGMGLERKDYSGKSNLDSLLKIDSSNFSLDAGSNETIKRIKGENADYNQIIAGIGKLVALRKNKKPGIVVSYVISKENYQDIEKATRDVRNIGADMIRFKIDLTAQNEIRELSDEIIRRLDIAKKCQSLWFRVVNIHSEDEIRGKNPDIFGRRMENIDCYTSAFWSCVGSDFQLYPCGHVCHGNAEAYGSLYEKTFEDIWESRKARKMRKELPHEGCYFCSPFSSRTNEFMTFLSSVPIKKIKELRRKYVGK